MASVPTGTVLGSIRRLFGGAGSIVGLGEGELLDRFISRRDEAAFEAIVARHGSMVLGVCRRVLNDPSDVDDAFQATFLVLVKKAAVIRDRDSLGPWLHGVARRVASKARANAARRKARELAGSRVESEPEASVGPLGEADRREFRAVIDEELGALPEKFRAPVILCYLEGLTHDEAASRLGLPVGTVRSRMSWARERLRSRLSRRGLALPGGLIASTLISDASAAVVPPALLHATVRSAIAVAAGKGVAAGVVSASVASLTGGVVQTMTFHKILGVAAGILAVGIASGGAVAVGQLGGSGQGQGQGQAAGTTQEKTVEKKDAPPNPELEIRNQIRQLDDGVQSLEVRIGSLNDDLGQVKEKRTRLIAQLETIRAKANPGSPPATPPIAEEKPKARSGFVSELEIKRAEADVAKAKAAIEGARAGVDKAKADLAIAEIEVLNTRRLLQSNGVSEKEMKLYEARFARAKAEVAAAEAGVSGVEPNLTVAEAELARLRRLELLGQPKPANPPAETGRLPGERTVITNDRLVVSMVGTNVVFVLDNETHKKTSVTFSKDYTVEPVLAGGMVALIIKGESIDQSAAYSTRNGEWVAPRIQEPAKRILPTINTRTIAVSRAGRFLYAFSAKTATWDMLEVPEGAPEWPTINGDKAQINYDGAVHEFLAETGRWSERLNPLVARLEKTANAAALKVVTSTDGRWVSILDPQRRGEQVFKASDGVRLRPNAIGNLVGLNIEGESIPSVAAYSSAKGGWVVQKLAEPFKGTISLDNNTEIVLNYVGRSILAFSGRTGTWDTIQLPAGVVAEIRPKLDGATASIILDGLLHAFRAETGRWELATTTTTPGKPEIVGAGAPTVPDWIKYGMSVDQSRVTVNNEKTGSTKIYAAEEGVTLNPRATAGLVYSITSGSPGHAIHELAAYAIDKDEWFVHKLPSPAEGTPHYAAGPSIVVYRAGSVYAAFSAKTGTWDDLPNPDAGNPRIKEAVQEVKGDTASVPLIGVRHVFSAETGKWSLRGSPAGKGVEFQVRVTRSPDGREVSVADSRDPKPKVYRAAEGLRITPMVDGGLVALIYEGENVGEVAAYSPGKRDWVVQKLSEPARRSIGLDNNTEVAVNYAGRSLAAFSERTGTWDILEIPADVSERRATLDGSTASITFKGIRHVFSAETGKWARETVPEKVAGAKPKVEEPVQNVKSGNLIIGYPADGGFLRVFDPEKKTSKVYKAPEGTKLTPLMGGYLIAPMYSGAKIPEIAAYSAATGEWAVQPLREPASKELTPILSNEYAYCQVGRHFYFFHTTINNGMGNPSTASWSVLDLPDDTPVAPEFDLNGPKMISGDFLYTYDYDTAKWSSVNMADPPKIDPAAEPKKKAAVPRGGLGQNPVGKARQGGGGMGGGPGGGGFGVRGGGMGGGGFGGGMGGGTPPKPSKFNRVESGSIVAVTSPGKIAAYSTERGTWSSLAIPEDIKATPILSGDLLAAVLEGPKIERLAVYNAKFGKWDEQGLLEPESGLANAIVGPNLVAYPVGRFVYAYSASAATWGVVERSAKDVNPVLGTTSITLDDGDRFLVFSATTGQWAALDDKPGEKSGPPPGSIMRNGAWASGDRFFSIRDDRTNSWKTFEVPEGTKVIANFAPMAELVAPNLEGPKITEVAVYNRRIGRWDVQPLREPASGSATAGSFGGVAFYRIGRFAYAYSIITSKWDILELPEGTPDEPVIISPSNLNGVSSLTSEVARLKGKDAMYTFEASTGRWKTTPIKPPTP